MTLMQKRLSKAGLARQTGQGVAATAATYAYGVDGGSIAKLDLSEDEIPLTWSNLDILGFDRKAVKPTQDIGTVGTPNLLGLLLLAALGADTVTGGASSNVSAVSSGGTSPTTITTAAAHGLTVGQQATIAAVGGATAVNGSWTVLSVPTATTFTIGVANSAAYTAGGTVHAPYSHLFTPAGVLPYMTAFGSFATADFLQIVDCKLSSLELSWDQAGHVDVKHLLAGVTPSTLAAQYTETNQELLSQVGFFTAGGGVFSIEGVSMPVSGGSVKIDNHIDQPGVAATVLPADVIEGKRQIDWSLKFLPSTTSLWREVYFGTGASGALSGITPFPHLGEVTCQFSGPNGTSLILDSTKVRFMVDFPESSPDGGAAELTLAGTSTLPVSGSALTATMTNAVAAY